MKSDLQTTHIYKITNKETGKSYIGKTIQDPQVRFNSHMNEAKRGQYKNYFHDSIRKHGRDMFHLELLETIDNEIKGYEREKFWVEELNCLSPNGYNSTTGGKGGMKPTKEVREKQSNAKKGKPTWNTGSGEEPYINRKRKWKKEHEDRLKAAEQLI